MEDSVKKILIVDDAMYFRNLKESYLKRDSCKLLTATNGEEALYEITTHKPDLIIMDFSMPTLNGEETCRLLKNHDDLKETPVIMVANSWDKNARNLCREAGCDDFILKPVDRKRLYSAIKRFLNTW